MKNRRALLSFAIGLLLFCPHRRLVAHPISEVVPSVRNWSPEAGAVVFQPTQIAIERRGASELQSVGKELQNDLKKMGFERPRLLIAEQKPARTIWLSIRARPQASSSPEGYTLSIQKEHILIEGTTARGVYCGTRTLLQMLQATQEMKGLGCGTAVDWPAYRHRGLMLDVARVPFPLSTLYRYLDRMAWYKMNELHLHLNDVVLNTGYSAFRVECKTFPELTSTDVFYTQDELRTFQDRAARLGIAVIPEIDMPGHAKCFTRIWPELAYEGITSSPRHQPLYLDIRKPETTRRLKQLLDEMVPLFDAPDFHIGTDEYRIGGWPDGPEFFALNDQLMRFINEMNRHVRGLGKNCRIWYGTDHIQSTVRPDRTLILDVWNLHRPKQLKIVQTHQVLNDNEFATYIVPGVNYYGVDNALVYRRWAPHQFGGKKDFSAAQLAGGSAKSNLLGGALHVWGDAGKNAGSMKQIWNLVRPSLQVFSEKLWRARPPDDSYDAFKSRNANKQPVPTAHKRSTSTS